MAEQIPTSPDTPAWLVAVLSIVSTVAAWKAWGPLGKWVGSRIDRADRHRAGERAGTISSLREQIEQLRDELDETRATLAEERELRSALAVENAELRRDVFHLQQQRVDDKRDCERAIRSLREELRELKHAREAGS